MNNKKKNNIYATSFTLIATIIVLSCSQTNTKPIEGNDDYFSNMQKAPQLRSYTQQTTSPNERREMEHKRDSLLLDFAKPVPTPSNSSYDFDLGVLGYGYDPRKGFVEHNPSLMLESNQNATHPVINMRDVLKDPYSLFYPTNVYIGESVFTTNSSTEISQSLYDHFDATISKIDGDISINISKFIASLSANINSSYKKSLNLVSDNCRLISLATGSQKKLTRSLSITIPNKTLRTPEKDIDPRFSVNSYSKKYFRTD